LLQPEVADKLETIQKRSEYLRINHDILSEGSLNNSHFDEHGPYYSNFTQDAVNFSPRRPLEGHFDFEEDNPTGSDLKPSKTEKLQIRKAFTFLCPTSIECPDQGCCPIGTYCTVVNGIVGCCDLPVFVFPSHEDVNR
jgi:hypothetical protein